MNNLFLLAALAVLTISCTSTETLDEKIQGEWKAYSFVINCDNPQNNIPFELADEDGCMNVWGASQCMTITFDAEGKGLISSDFGVGEIIQEVFDYSLNEARQIVEVCQDFNCVEFSIVEDRLLQIMDEDDCLCEFEYDKKD